MKRRAISPSPTKPTKELCEGHTEELLEPALWTVQVLVGAVPCNS